MAYWSDRKKIWTGTLMATGIGCLLAPVTLSAAPERNVVLVKGRLSFVELLSDAVEPNALVPALSAREHVEVQEVLIGPAGLKQFEVITKLRDEPGGELYILASGLPGGPMRAAWIDWVSHGLCVDDAIAKNLGAEEAIRKLKSGKEACKQQ